MSEEADACWMARALSFSGPVDVTDAESLRGLVAAADYVNHAIPEAPEIVGGLRGLAARRLLEADGSRVRLLGKLDRRPSWKRVQQAVAEAPLGGPALEVDEKTAKDAIARYRT